MPATVVAPEHAPQTKLDAIARLGGDGDQGAVRALVGDDGGRRLPRARRALRPPRARRARDGRQRHDRPRARRGSDAIDTVLVPWGGGGLSTASRARSRPSRPRRACSPASPRRAPRWPRRSPPASRLRSTYTASFVDGAGHEGAAAGHVGAGPGVARRRHRAPAWRTAEAVRTLATAPTSWPRAQAHSRSRPPSPVTRARAGSCASSRAGTSTPTRLATILAGDVPQV